MSGGLLDGLARILATAGIGDYTPDGPLTGAWPICVEAQPAEPGQSITLYEYAGAASPGNQPKWAEPNVTVRVRGNADSTVSRDKAQAVLNRLHGLTYTELPDGIYVVDCTCPQSVPVHVGPDSNGLHQHTVGLRLSIEYP